MARRLKFHTLIPGVLLILLALIIACGEEATPTAAPSGNARGHHGPCSGRDHGCGPSPSRHYRRYRCASRCPGSHSHGGACPCRDAASSHGGGYWDF